MAATRSTRWVLTPFPHLEFHGELRPSQRDVVALAHTKLASRAERRLHIVAPPGAGKTVLGLYIWAQVVQRPAVVLSPMPPSKPNGPRALTCFRTVPGSETW
jgi:superfamily II DNA or RNA helicase